MTPADALIPMKTRAHDKQLGCMSCHGAHRFEPKRAAVDGCLSCHDDQHSLAYKASPHYSVWLKSSGESSYGKDSSSKQKTEGTEGASCATCHMPRINHEQDGIKRLLVSHNQNDNLRPNEKMLRSVCMNCHGLEFSIDALADPELIENNFKGKPGIHIESMDLAIKRVNKKASN